MDNQKYKTFGLLCEGLHADECSVKKTLSVTPRPWYHWKVEDLSSLHVLLVLVVNLESIFITIW
jgi:hypothetical protein